MAFLIRLPVFSKGTASQPPLAFRTLGRSFATHRDRPTSSTSTADLKSRLEAQMKLGNNAIHGQDRVGPFPLGVGPSGRDKTWRSWRQLGLGGKREVLSLLSVGLWVVALV